MSPATASARPFSVLVVCSGNICRSPMAEKVLRHAFEEAGLGQVVSVSSAGTGHWHVGQGMYATAERALTAAGYPTQHVARQVTKQMVDEADLVLAADRSHLRVLRSLASDPASVQLLRRYDPRADGDEVPDPYGLADGEFARVLAMLQAAAPGLVDEVGRRIA